jgi:lactoylglutathione lyase
MELFVDDLDAGIAFWTGVLGFALDRRTNGYASLRRGTVVLGLGPIAKLPAGGETPDRTAPGFTRAGMAGERGAGVEIVLEVDTTAELVDLHDRCATAGVVVAGLTDQPWGLRDFRFTDPNGYYVRVTDSALT